MGLRYAHKKQLHTAVAACMIYFYLFFSAKGKVLSLLASGQVTRVSCSSLMNSVMCHQPMKQQQNKKENTQGQSSVLVMACELKATEGGFLFVRMYEKDFLM